MKKWIFLLFLIPITSYGALADDLVSYWIMDEASGTRVDSHGSNDLTDVNTVLSSAGCVSTVGADFERSNNEYFSISSATGTGLNGTGDFSYQEWVNFETVPGGYPNYQTGSNLGWYDNSHRAYTIYYGGIDVSVSSTGSGGTTATLSWTPTGSTCYHVVYMYDASAQAIYLYVDGVLVDSDVGTLPSSRYATDGSFYISGDTDAGQAFDGIKDNVAFWNRLLTEDEIIELYCNGEGQEYPFNGCGGSVATSTTITGDELFIWTIVIFILSIGLWLFILSPAPRI